MLLLHFHVVWAFNFKHALGHRRLFIVADGDIKET